MTKINNVFSMFKLADLNLNTVHLIKEDSIPEGLYYGEVEKVIAYRPLEEDEDPNEYLMVNEETIQSMYAEVVDGYRGVGCYWGVAKVDNKWWLLDVVSDGVAYQLEGLTDDEVANMFADCIVSK